MKIKEVSDRTGLSRKTIRFYEAKSLFSPVKTYRNGKEFRDYSEEHVQQLKKIATLRRARFTVEEIRRMKDTPEETAAIIREKRALGLDGGVLITNPIPEEDSMDAKEINAVIDKALAEMDEKGIKGKECTPFLLAKVAEITGGDSLAANIKLVFNNAAVGSEIAKAYFAK